MIYISIFQHFQIQRDPETGNSKGFAFINYASFEASDVAIDSMNGQYLCNRAISISYAFKKDSKGERHGRYFLVFIPLLFSTKNIREKHWIFTFLVHIISRSSYKFRQPMRTITKT